MATQKHKKDTTQKETKQEEVCQEEEKKNSKMKEKLSKFVPIFGTPNFDCPKNLAVYLEKKRKKKIRNMIIFAIFSAIVLSVFILSLLVEPIFGTYSSITAFVNRHILQNAYEYVRNAETGYYEQVAILGHPAIRSVVVVSVGYIIITLASVIVKLFAVGNANKRRRTVVSLASSMIKYIGYVIVLIMMLNVWGVNPAILATIVGALGIALGFGAQGLISDLLTGLFLIFENALQVGDIVTVDGFRGEVEEVGIRTTRIRSVIGDVKVINNSQLKKFINMSMHRSLAICDVTIEYGEDVKKVEEIITAHLEVVAEKYPVISEGPFYKGIALFNERGVVLRIVAKCDEVERLQLDRDLNREFKLLFDQNGIRLAVPRIDISDEKEKKTKKK